MVCDNSIQRHNFAHVVHRHAGPRTEFLHNDTVVFQPRPSCALICVKVAPDQVADCRTMEPLKVIAAEHDLHAALCDLLEAIADALPASVNRDQCARAVEALKIDLPRHHADEEYGLFPLLREACEQNEISEILARLEEDHLGDEANSLEIVPILEILAAGGKPENPDMFGYMLRGFFEAYRRHIEWENRVVLPLAHARLDEEALAKLSQVMIKNRSALGKLKPGAGPMSNGRTETDITDVRTLLRGLCGKAEPPA